MPPAPDSAVLLWATAAASGAPMGMQHYERNVIGALRRLDPSWTLRSRTVGSLRTPGPVDRRLPMGALERGRHWRARLAGWAAYRGAAAVHRFDLRLPPASVPEAVTVHDLPPLRFADEGSLPSWSVPSARGASVVIAPSAFAADEVSRLTGATRVVVIPNGVDDLFRTAAPLSPQERAAQRLPLRFVLHAGGASDRKNLAALAGAWADLSRTEADLGLVLVGPPDPRRDAMFRTLPGTVLVGHRPAEQVAALMATASAVVVPSTYEGFGLPAAEGLAVGTPVVAADRGALPEVCGDAALLVPPSAEGLAAGLREVLHDADATAERVRRGREQVAGLTWEASARQHLACYDAWLR